MVEFASMEQSLSSQLSLCCVSVSYIYIFNKCEDHYDSTVAAERWWNFWSTWIKMGKRVKW